MNVDEYLRIDNLDNDNKQFDLIIKK